MSRDKRKIQPSVAHPTAKKPRLERLIPATNKSQKKFELKQSGSKPVQKATGTVTRNSRQKQSDERPVKVPRDQKPPADNAAEFEWDSDPIEESETGEESGADDGISWPSDNDNDGGADGYDELLEDEGMQEDDEADDADEVNDVREEEDSTGVRLNGPGTGRQATVGGGIDAKAAKTDGQSSREAHQKQKETLKERKMAKPNADEIQRSKKLWERLRRQSHVPLQERKKLIAELFELVTGRVKEFVLKHDAGRVVQTALKYGNLDQRRSIAGELRGCMAELAESKYAKFMIGKLVSYGDKGIRDLVVPEFYGRVRRCMRHSEASWILDDIYRAAASRQQKARLLSEWYGPEFSLFNKDGTVTETSDLAEILEKYPEKRRPIMKYLWDMINLLVQKKTTGFTMLHDAMLQYYLNVQSGSEEAAEFIELLKGDEEYDLMKNLAFTQPGVRVVTLALSYGTAKDRKLLLRAYKDTIGTMAFDSTAHAVLLTAEEVVDDTVLVSKTIFAELMPKDLSSASKDRVSELLNLVTDVNARSVILAPFLDNLSSLIRPTPLERVREAQKIRETTSKKDAQTRKRELARALSPVLLALIEQKAGELIHNSFGCVFICEVLTRAEGDKNAALRAVASLASDEGVDTEAPAPALQAPAGGKMLKTLVQGGRFDVASKEVLLCQPRLHFADLLYDRICEGGGVLRWATSASAFVVVALLETTDFEDETKQALLRQTLREGRTELLRVAEETSKGDIAAASQHTKGKRAKMSKAQQGPIAEDQVAGGGTAVAAKGAKRILALLE